MRLAGNGQMVALAQAKYWFQTPLGPFEPWLQSLRTSVSLCLTSGFPINTAWGPSGCRFTTTAIGYLEETFFAFSFSPILDESVCASTWQGVS
jgi:hypothetical protein